MNEWNEKKSCRKENQEVTWQHLAIFKNSWGRKIIDMKWFLNLIDKYHKYYYLTFKLADQAIYFWNKLFS